MYKISKNFVLNNSCISLLFLGSIMTLFSSNTAFAGFQVCNHRSKDIRIAVAYDFRAEACDLQIGSSGCSRFREASRAEGWWVARPGECKRVISKNLSTHLTNDVVYLRVEDMNDGWISYINNRTKARICFNYYENFSFFGYGDILDGNEEIFHPLYIDDHNSYVHHFLGECSEVVVREGRNKRSQHPFNEVYVGDYDDFTYNIK